MENIKYSHTFEIFPKFLITSSSQFKKENMSNFKGMLLNVVCNHQWLYSLCLRINNNIYGFGRMFHIINTFIEFINATADWTIEQNNEFGHYYQMEKFDLWTKLKVATVKDSIAMYPFINEMYSNSLENYDILLIVPKAKFIESFLYIVKPFTLSLWLSLLGYLTYGSVILSLAIYLIYKDLEVWTIFDQLLRTLISQSYIRPFKGPIFSIIYMLAMIFGFIVTIWYSALLGSFLTTYLREPQISTLPELIESKTKIMSSSNHINSTSGYNNIKDSLFFIPKYETSFKLFNSNYSFGYFIPSMTWEISSLSDNYFAIKHFYLERSFVRFILPIHGIYKQRFNRFVDIIKDTGLYEFWKRQLYYEWRYFGEELPIEMNQHRNIPEDHKRILDVKYFVYPFSFLVISCILGVVLFILEIIWIKCERKFASTNMF